MRDSELQSLSLLKWTLQIWGDYRRGVPQSGQVAAIAHCMRHHKEWWSGWEAARESGETPSITTRLAHIHNDAAIRSQLDSGDPEEIRSLFDTLCGKGFTEFESIHTLALALMEEKSWIRQHNETFDPARYIDRAKRYTDDAISRPNLRLSGVRIASEPLPQTLRSPTSQPNQLTLFEF